MMRIGDWRWTVHAAGRTAAAAVVWVVALVATAVLLAFGPSCASAQGPAAYEVYDELSGVRPWYVDSSGYGPVVVQLNTGTSQTWQLQIGLLSAAGCRVIAFDRRGRGRGRSLANPATASC